MRLAQAALVADPRGPYRKVSLLTKVTRPRLMYPFRGYSPPAGMSWKFHQQRLIDLDDDSRISWSSRGVPTLKHFYADEGTPEGSLQGTTAELIIRTAMRSLVKRLAICPNDLFTLEWRDLERVLREVFEGLGLQTRLTRPSQDGGFDLEISSVENFQTPVYLVEVKHWKTSRPGRKVYADFVDVVVSQGATKGLLLSTSGFRKNLLQMRLKIECQTVRLGASDKIVELCQLYTRKGYGVWQKSLSVPNLLFDATF